MVANKESPAREGIGREALVRAAAVHLVLEGRSEDALQLLSQYYNVEVPKLRVGLPKRCLKALGCYVPRERTIYVKSSSEYRNPFIILHEYYHHLRSIHWKHRGTEKNADMYAAESIAYYNLLKNMGLLDRVLASLLDD
jgi:hypothetical protein